MNRKFILIAVTKISTYTLKYMGEGFEGSKYAWTEFYKSLNIISARTKEELIAEFEDIKDIIPKTDWLGYKIEKVYIRQLE